MYFESIGDLWHMAGHGAFVWSAYGISALVLVSIIAQPLLRFRSELKRLQLMSTINSNPGAIGSDNVALADATQTNTGETNVDQARVKS